MSDWAKIFGAEEWAYIQAMGAAIHNPQDKRDFWENVKKCKQENPNFSVYSLFPKDLSGTTNKKNDKQIIAVKYCQEIIMMLKGNKDDVGKEENGEIQCAEGFRSRA
jgi:hypothetical protein